MAFTPSDLAIVEGAILQLASGKRVTELRFSDRWMRYESATMNDLIKLRDQIKGDIARQNGRKRIFRIRHGGKGV